jgi:cytochrome c peroxidase
MQYEDPTKTLMMLPTDMALVGDRKFRRVVQEFAKDEDAFRAAFVDAFGRLLDLGVPRA